MDGWMNKYLLLFDAKNTEVPNCNVTWFVPRYLKRLNK